MNELILIVDDELSTLKLLGMALEREGYRIAGAQDARQALARIDAEIPELLILDVMMPGVSGLDLVGQLRARRDTATLPVILLSAKGEVADRVAGLKAGADEYLVKPIDTAELMARVASLLERTRRLRADFGGRPTKVISFIGAKGGTGTTCVTLNVGIALASAQTEAIAVELRGHAGTFPTLLGMKAVKGLDGLVELDPRVITAQEVGRRLVRHATGLQVLCAPEKIGFEQLGLPQAEAILFESPRQGRLPLGRPSLGAHAFRSGGGPAQPGRGLARRADARLRRPRLGHGIFSPGPGRRRRHSAICRRHTLADRFSHRRHRDRRARRLAGGRRHPAGARRLRPRRLAWPPDPADGAGRHGVPGDPPAGGDPALGSRRPEPSSLLHFSRCDPDLDPSEKRAAGETAISAFHQ